MGRWRAGNHPFLTSTTTTSAFGHRVERQLAARGPVSAFDPWRTFGPRSLRLLSPASRMADDIAGARVVFLKKRATRPCLLPRKLGGERGAQRDS